MLANKSSPPSWVIGIELVVIHSDPMTAGLTAVSIPLLEYKFLFSNSKSPEIQGI